MVPAFSTLSAAVQGLLLASLLGSSAAALSFADKHALRAWPSVRSVRTVRTSGGVWKPRDTTPPMGWNPYNHWQGGIDETIFKQTVDALTSTGLADLGYTYVNLDDRWSCKGRDEQGNLKADENKFPNGIRALASYAHKRGLKFGIYGDAGFKTCSFYPGSLYNEERDAKTFAKWGVDFLKFDNCFNDLSPARKRYGRMRQALDKTGRDIHFNLCEWGLSKPAKWARSIGGDSWRTSQDIADTWDKMMKSAILNDEWAEYAGPGGWNDPDMLEVGNGGMSNDEYRVQFSLWAVMKAPLILGNDIRNMDDQTLAIISNKEVIAINQDPLGIQGRLVNSTDKADIWAGPLSGGRMVVALVNKDNHEAQRITVTKEELRLRKNGYYDIRKIWERKSYKAQFVGDVSMWVKPHHVGLLVLTPSAKTSRHHKIGQKKEFGF